MAENPISGPISDPSGKEYDVGKAETLAKWNFGLLEHAADARKEMTSEKDWSKTWKFVGGDQWSGQLPSYRRPVVLNVWRRAIHQAISVLTGDRPLLKIVPYGKIDKETLSTWQMALWSVLKNQDVMRSYADAMLWALVADGGWLKVGWGQQSPSEPGDVMCMAAHPGKVFPSPDCTDVRLTNCAYILYQEVLDLSAITSKFPEQGWRVKPDGASYKWDSKGAPEWVADTIPTTISPSGGWACNREYRRARAEILETCIDDSSTEWEPKEDPLSPLKNGKWVPKYPYGRLITCTRDVVLRDIPNPLGSALGWARRWPYVYVPGAEEPHTLWRPGMLANQQELQRSTNKALSLVIENMIKVTNALIIGDDMAMDDEEWDMLSLVPGAKIKKRAGTEVKVVFPEQLSEGAFKMPDYLGTKIEQSLGIQDPPLPAGQAVAARTVQFLMMKGNFVLGDLASLGDQALGRLGDRLLGIMRKFYLTGREIPFFEGEELKEIRTLSALPSALQLRVEPSSGWTEVQASMAAVAQMESQQRGKK